MYTLVLIVIAHGMSGTVSVATTHYPVPSKESCENMRRLLEADSSREIRVEVHCLPQ